MTPEEWPLTSSLHVYPHAHTDLHTPPPRLMHMHTHRKRSSNEVRMQSARWGLKRALLPAVRPME